MIFERNDAFIKKIEKKHLQKKKQIDIKCNICFTENVNKNV